MKIGIILPYFGYFNNYFHIWMDSVKHNPDIDWLLFTDQIIDGEVPSNCIVHNMQFDDLIRMFESKFKMNINLARPYKLCDYRAYYGWLFSDFLGGYDFWGYCDCDVVFGDIKKYVTDDLLEQYDKLFRRGHLSFVRNIEEINRNFLNYETYKTVIKSPVNYGYDESIKGYHLGFAGELMNSGFRFYDATEHIADIDYRYYPFYRAGGQHKPVAFSYHSGRLYELSPSSDGLAKNEIMYVHFQKRKFDYVTSHTEKAMYIVPNKIVESDGVDIFSEELWKKISSEKEDYYDFKKEKRDSLIRDIKRFAYEPRKIDSLLYRFSKGKIKK